MPSNFSTVNVTFEDKIDLDKIMFLMKKKDFSIEINQVIGELIKLYKKEHKKEFDKLEDELKYNILNSAYRKNAIGKQKLKNE